MREYTYRTVNGPVTVKQASCSDIWKIMSMTKKGKQVLSMLSPPGISANQMSTKKKRLAVKMMMALAETLLYETIENGNLLVLPGNCVSICVRELQGREKKLVRLCMDFSGRTRSGRAHQFFRAGHSPRITVGNHWFTVMQETAKTIKYRNEHVQL